MATQTPTPYAQPSQTKSRSAIPKVLGIIAIVFSVIGLSGAALQTLGDYKDRTYTVLEASEMGAFGTWIYAYGAFAVIVFGLHLTAGILSVRYSPRCIKWMNTYAMAALLLSLANITITALIYPEQLVPSEGNVGRIVIEAFAVPWPIVVLSLMNLRRTREATCDALDHKISTAKVA